MRLDSQMVRECARNSSIFLALFAVSYVLGATGYIDSFFWGAISMLLYFPASLSEVPIDTKIDAFTRGMHFDVLGRSVEAFHVFSFVANGFVGVLWWTFVTATYVLLRERS